MSEILGLICARGGSKSIPRKNIALLAGKPMIAWTIEAALKSPSLTRAVVSTDDDEIAEVAKHWGADVPFLRPAELARDDTPGIEPVLHALRWLAEHESYHPDYVMLLQPTSPLRTARHIDEAIDLFESSCADTVTSVRVSQEHPAWTWREAGGTLVPYSSMREMELDRGAMPRTFVETGAIYVIRTAVLEAGRIYGGKVVGYLMDARDSVDIDTTFDLQWAEFILGPRPHGQGQQ